MANSQCTDGFILRGQRDQPIRSAAIFNLSSQPFSSVTGGVVRTGTYSLYSISLTDMAGNVAVYRDTALGGTYNRASHFGGNTIVIKP